MPNFGPIPPALIEKLKDRAVVPFVGAGVSQAVLSKNSNEPIFPSWKGLMEAGIKQLKAQGKNDDARPAEALLKGNEYLRAADWIEDGLKGRLSHVVKEQIGKNHEDIQDESLELARLIWQLGSSLVITTNYDKVLEWAAPHPGNCRRLVNSQEFELGDLHRDHHDTVWHLHGHVDDARSVVLTSSSYARLYSREHEWNAALTILRQIMATKSLLFIGYGMGDIQIIEQLQEIDQLFNGAPGPHYVLAKEELKYLIEGKKLPVEVITYENHGEPLLELLQAMKPSPKAHALTSPPPIASTTALGVADFGPQHPSFNVPYRQKGAQVLGRSTQLEQVRKQLTEGVATSIGQVASFDGIGGLGKTQLAVEYAYTFRDQYPNGVVWLNADVEIEPQLTALAEGALWVSPQSDHKSKLDIALRRLKTYSDCLLIFDNVEQLKDIEAYFPENQAHPHILITCRTPQMGFKSIPLDVLHRDVSLQLLFQEAGKHPVGDVETSVANQIVEALGDLPLAIELAGAFIQRFQVEWKDYLDLLQADLPAALPSGFSSFTRHEADLYRTLHIDERIFTDVPLLRDVLDVLTWSGTAPMGTDLLAAILSVSPTQLVTALSEGVVLRLLQKTTGGKSHAIHRLVQQVRQSEIPLSQRISWVQTVSEHLGNWFESKRANFGDLPEFERETPHLAAWQKHAGDLVPREGSRLLWLQAYPHFHRGRYYDAQQIVEEALGFYREMKIESKELEANLINDLGSLMNKLKNHQKASELHNQALSIRRGVLGERHPDTANSLNNLASAHYGMKQYEKALGLHNQAFSIRREVLGERHPDTAISLNNLASVYSATGQYEKALELYNQALSIELELLGEKHPSTANSFNNLAGTYQGMRQYEKALELYNQALSIQLELLGEKHPSTATSLNNLATVYSATGQYEKALELHDQALSIRREVLGERHPDTAISLNNLATVYHEMKQHEKALELHNQALSIQREVLGERHPASLNSTRAVASMLDKNGDSVRAFRLLDEVLMKLDRNQSQFADLEKQAIQMLRKSRKSQVGIAQVIQQHKAKWRRPTKA